MEWRILTAKLYPRRLTAINRMKPNISSFIPASRLDLRLLSADHCSQIMEARIESFNQLKAWDIWVPEDSAESINAADEMKMCAWRIDRIKKHESIFYNIFQHETGRFLGSCSLTECDWISKKAMLGFWLRTSETGKGYATEAAEALLNYGTDVLGLTIYAMHARGNLKSRGVLLRLGLKQRPAEANGSSDNVYYESTKP